MNYKPKFKVVPIVCAFIVPFVCLFKKPLAEGTTSFKTISRTSLQLRWDSQACLSWGHHPVELLQHSQVPCKNTQSNNGSDPPTTTTFVFQCKSDFSTSRSHVSVPGRAAPVWVVQQRCQLCNHWGYGTIDGLLKVLDLQGDSRHWVGSSVGVINLKWSEITAFVGEMDRR